MYYNYDSLEEIKRRMSLGEVLSGFTIRGNCDKLMISYGAKLRSGSMNCIGITRMNKGESRKFVGFTFVKCKLDMEDTVMINMNVDIIESRMEHYFLMLPLIDDGNFAEEYAIVYDDWDTSDEYFHKVLPSLCPYCMNVDVLP